MSVLDNVRVFNKRLLNPLMLRFAGRKYWYASVIEHTGRRSGKHFATPVATEGGTGWFRHSPALRGWRRLASKRPCRRARDHPGSWPVLPSATT